MGRGEGSYGERVGEEKRGDEGRGGKRRKEKGGEERRLTVLRANQ